MAYRSFPGGPKLRPNHSTHESPDFDFAVLARCRLYIQPPFLELFFSFSIPNDSGVTGARPPAAASALS
jgi:hypothetical protein